MVSCNTCGAHVSRQFQRVFGDGTGTVYACPDCATSARLGRTARDRKAREG